MRPLTVIESPYRGATLEEADENLAYAREALAHSIAQGECPVASHLLYTQALNDEIPAEREQGLELALELLRRADRLVFYVDRGLSRGMYRTLEALYPSRSLPAWEPGYVLEQGYYRPESRGGGPLFERPLLHLTTPRYVMQLNRPEGGLWLYHILVRKIL